MTYREFDPHEMPIPERHHLLLAGVAPRPIALVATVSSAGEVNLSPFSFFNAFGANPPVVAFSPSFRGKDGTPKHTYLNLLETRECTISVVTHAMVEQVSLASSDYPASVDEFIKSGLTKLPSSLVKPPGVAESPYIMECRLLQHVALGGEPASGNLMICEVHRFRVRDDVFVDGKIDPRKMDVVARLGYRWYCRTSGDALFTLGKPSRMGIGFDQLPPEIRESRILTGNDLAKLAGIQELPDRDEIMARWNDRIGELGERRYSHAEFHRAFHESTPDEALNALLPAISDGKAAKDHIHQLAQLYLRRDDVVMAWEVLYLAGED